VTAQRTERLSSSKGEEVRSGEDSTWAVSEMALDTLAVVLPGARLVFDWLLEQEELALKCTMLLEQGLL